MFVIFGLIFTALGFFLSGAFALIRKLIRKGKTEEQEELPLEEYVKPDTTEQKSRPITITLVRRIILAVVAVALIMISIKFFPGTKAIDAEAFSKAAEAAGYTTTDTTEKIRQEWRVGSMLTEAASLNNKLYGSKPRLLTEVQSPARCRKLNTKRNGKITKWSCRFLFALMCRIFHIYVV